MFTLFIRPIVVDVENESMSFTNKTRLWIMIKRWAIQVVSKA